jgi:cold shock CspA family protein
MVSSVDGSQEVDDDTDDDGDAELKPSLDSVTHVVSAVQSIDGSRDLQPSPVHLDNEKKGSSKAHPEQRDSSREQLSVGWRVATCMRWHSAYGFLLVDTSHPPVHEHFTIAVESPASELVVPAEMLVDKQRNKSSSSTVKVYVHRSALKSKPNSQKMLSNGEYVLALIKIDDKGPKAVVVKDLFSRQVTPT